MAGWGWPDYIKTEERKACKVKKIESAVLNTCELPVLKH